MERTLFIFALLAQLPVNAQEVDSSKYNIKDLEVLEREKNYQEFFKHAYDIRPSERGKYWKKIYQNMAAILIDSKIKNNEYSEVSFKQIENIGKNSPLKDDEIFQIRRVDYAKLYFKNCFESSVDKNKCANDLQIHWENSNQDPDAALLYTKWLENFSLTNNLWTFYNAIINDQLAQMYCQKPEIQRAVIKKIKDESAKTDFDGSYKGIISKFISDKCIKEIYPTLKDALTSNITSGFDKEIAYYTLEQMKNLPAEDKDFYLTVYLFSGPVTGEKMNEAWKLIETLSENYTKRNLILEKFKKLELIPDGVMADPELPRHKAIINLFSRNFPELLSYYSSECKNFLKSKSDTHVSSSKKCELFFSYNEKNNWVIDGIESKMSAPKR